MNLQYTPALGFQTAGCNANKWYAANYGTLTSGTPAAPDAPVSQSQYVSGMRKTDIVMKLKGYCPLWGIKIGIERIALATGKNYFGSSKCSHVIRGLMELIPFVGTLLVFPDLAMTYYRKARYKATPITLPPSSIPEQQPRASTCSTKSPFSPAFQRLSPASSEGSLPGSPPPLTRKITGEWDPSWTHAPVSPRPAAPSPALSEGSLPGSPPSFERLKTREWASRFNP